MNTKAIGCLLVMAIVFSSFFLVTKALNAKEESPTQISDISAQLQQIVQNQQLIISKLNDMKEELRIIKIRTAVKR